MINISKKNEEQVLHFYNFLGPTWKKALHSVFQEEQEMSYVSDIVFSEAIQNSHPNIILALFYSAILQVPFQHLIKKSYKDKDFRITLGYRDKPYLTLLRHSRYKDSLRWEEHTNIEFSLTPGHYQQVERYIEDIRKDPYYGFV